MWVTSMTTTRNYSHAFGFVVVVVDSRHGHGDCGSVWRDQLSQSDASAEWVKNESEREKEQGVLEREFEQKHRLVRAFYYNLQPATFVGSLLFVCLFAFLCVCVYCILIVLGQCNSIVHYLSFVIGSRTVQNAWRICTLNKILCTHKQENMSVRVCVCGFEVLISRIVIVLHWPFIIAAEFC